MNHYEPPQVTECRGPCGDSRCPHIKALPWPFSFKETAGIILAIGVSLTLVIWQMTRLYQADALQKWGPQINQPNQTR